jgi:hypothetical protein
MLQAGAAPEREGPLEASYNEFKGGSEPWSSGKGVEQVKAIEAYPCVSRLIIEAGWASFQRTQGLLKGPLLGVDKVRDRTVLRHGTDDFRPLFVSEQIVGVIARIRLGCARLLNGFHDVTYQG